MQFVQHFFFICTFDVTTTKHCTVKYNIFTERQRQHFMMTNGWQALSPCVLCTAQENDDGKEREREIGRWRRRKDQRRRGRRERKTNKNIEKRRARLLLFFVAFAVSFSFFFSFRADARHTHTHLWPSGARGWNVIHFIWLGKQKRRMEMGDKSHRQQTSRMTLSFRCGHP